MQGHTASRWQGLNINTCLLAPSPSYRPNAYRDVAGRIVAPSKDIYILVPVTQECITLHRKRNFADVVKCQELEDCLGL